MVSIASAWYTNSWEPPALLEMAGERVEQAPAGEGTREKRDHAGPRGMGVFRGQRVKG
jgi:hypothetical protein